MKVPKLVPVRLHLNHALQFWFPKYRKDIGLLESLQRRMSEGIQRMKNIPYKDRFKGLNLYSLRLREV